METCGFEVRTREQGTELKLAMQRLWLTGQVLPLGARLLVRHVFRNGEDQPLEVIYGFMLPREAALRRFEVEGEGFQAHSELRRVKEAVKAYEQGIEAGHLATLARSYRDGVVNLTLGNLKKGEQVAVTLEILAGVELHDDGLRFRFPFALAPGYHSQMRAMDVGGLGEIELPQKEFGDVILPRFKRDAENLHEVGFDLALRIPGTIVEIGSPSHAVRLREEQGARRITLAPASDVPNRDLVLDVRVAESKTQVMAGNKRFAMLVPSTRFGQVSNQPRKVAMVIDRSGSMGGQPMIQAKRAVEACLGALAQDDEFALVAFDNQAESFRNTLTPATSESRNAACKFLKGIDARGGTFLPGAFSVAARLLQGGGDVLIITDGQVMGTEEILAQARALKVRIHCLGIGSASQDRFLALLASATEGVSRFVTPHERVDVAAVDLFASIGRPVATEVQATGAAFDIEPSHAVFAGTPWVAFGHAPNGAEVKVAWAGGKFAEAIPAVMPEIDETLHLIEGSRRIADLESRMTHDLQEEMEASLARLSEQFGLASRAMALVAVVKRAGDQAGSPPVTRVVPVGMPQGTGYDSYFGAPAAAKVTGAFACAPMAMAPPPPRSLHKSIREVFGRLVGGKAEADYGAPLGGGAGFDNIMSAPLEDDDLEETAAVPLPVDRMFEIARSLSPDGGLPGNNAEDRALKTAIAVLFFLEQGQTPSEGAFRAHVERMVRFLEHAAGPNRKVIESVIAFARAGKKPSNTEMQSWKEVEAAIA
jgi:Ca-activated chloride channel family protein